MTETPRFDGIPAGNLGPRVPPVAWSDIPPPPPGPAEWRELADLIGQGIHAISHSLAQIAADLHAIRGQVEAAAPVARAYQRGGTFAAMTAARQQRKNGGTPQ
jgi:hypothetical protein